MFQISDVNATFQTYLRTAEKAFGMDDKDCGGRKNYLLRWQKQWGQAGCSDVEVRCSGASELRITTWDRCE